VLCILFAAKSPLTHSPLVVVSSLVGSFPSTTLLMVPLEAGDPTVPHGEVMDISTRPNPASGLSLRPTVVPIPHSMMLFLTLLIPTTLCLTPKTSAMPTVRHRSSQPKTFMTTDRRECPVIPSPDLSFLESRSIAPATYQSYRVLLLAFIAWCQRAQVNWNSSSELDNVLVAYFDRLFWHGDPCAQAASVWRP
jgi:hypothetical protein